MTCTVQNKGTFTADYGVLIRTRRSRLKPLPSQHANLRAVIELEVNLIHEVSNKEYAPAVEPTDSRQQLGCEARLDRIPSPNP